MDYEYDCFISYSHKDEDNTRFAQRLTQWLQLAGLRVWRDKSEIPGGRAINETIHKGLDSSRCLVCLVSEAWYESDFTGWELEVFKEKTSKARVIIPVLLTERNVARLGPELTRRHAITGFTDPNQVDAALWQLYCALTGKDLGPQSDWQIGGKSLRQKLPPGQGGLRITGLPDGIEPSKVRVGTEPWDGNLVLGAPAPVTVELCTSELYFKREVPVKVGEITEIQLKPAGVIWPPDEARWRPGSGPAADIKTYVIFDRTKQAVLAARIAYIANRVAGHSVLPESWAYFKEKGDGRLDRYISVNSMLYHESDRETAESLCRHLLRADPIIRLAKHMGGTESRAQFLGVEPFPDGFRPKRIFILLVEDK